MECGSLKSLPSCSYAGAYLPGLILLCLSLRSKSFTIGLQVMYDDSEIESDYPGIMYGILDSHGQYGSAEFWDQSESPEGSPNATAQYEGDSALLANTSTQQQQQQQQRLLASADVACSSSRLQVLMCHT